MANNTFDAADVQVTIDGKTYPTKRRKLRSEQPRNGFQLAVMLFRYEWLGILLALFFIGCMPQGAAQTALDELGPPALRNPYVSKGVPLCTTGLTQGQRDTLSGVLNEVNSAFPLARLSQVALPKCLPLQPTVVHAPNLARGGYTSPDYTQGAIIQIRDFQDLCTVRHEVWHYVGLIKHSDPRAEPLGVMSNGGDRGECGATAADIAILTRTYTGRWPL